MRVLTPSYWQHFKQRGSRKGFDGIMFENLVRDLLQTYFEGSWEPTSISWDGGKDFIDRSIAGKQGWAECKMYEKKLSIKIISNSLVMAVNAVDVQDIIIFSYSALNQNAILHLSSFSSVTSINVRVFDDDRLEELILGNAYVLNKFFDVKRNVKKPVIQNLEIVSLFSVDTSIEYSQLSVIEGIRKKRTPIISINTPCLYEIFFRSHEILKKTVVQIKLSEIKKLSYELGWLNSDFLGLTKAGLIKLTLIPGQVISVKLFFSPTVQIGQIPSVPIRFSGDTKELPPFDIEVSNLNRPSLIGGYIYSALDNFKQKITSLNRVATFAVSGKTGVGKSRFIEESKIRLLGQNFLVLQIDGRSNLTQTFNLFVADLLSQVWRLPNTHLLRDSHDESIKSEQRDTLFDRVCKRIIKATENNVPSTKDIQEIFELFSIRFLRQRMAVLIDNVQGLDKGSLQLIAKIIEALNGTIGQNAVILAFNEDELIYSQEATLIHQKLKKFSLQKNNTATDFFSIPEFNEESVKAFLNTICASIDREIQFTEHYPLLTNFILKNVLPRPLDIYQLFLAAQDETRKCATIENGFFFIRDVNSFIDLVRNISGKTENIYETRLLSLKGSTNLLTALLAVSCYGEIDSSTLFAIAGINRKHAQELVELGWLKHTAGNRLSFFHPSIERYVIRTIIGETNLDPNLIFPLVLRSKLLNTLKKSRYANSYKLPQFFLARYKSKLILQKALTEIRELSSSAGGIREKLYAQSILSYVTQTQRINPSIYLDCVLTLCAFAAEGRISDLLDKLVTMRKSLLNFIPTTDNQAFLLFQLGRQLASYASLLGRPEEGDNSLKSELLLVDKLPASISQYAKNRIMVNLLNRRCVCLKDLGKLGEAKLIGEQALNLARKNDFKDFVCLALIDLSAIYKNEKKNLIEYTSYIQQALDFFYANRQEIDDPSLELSCWENEAKLKDLQGKPSEAIDLAEKVIAIAYERNDIYYLLRGLSIKAIVLARREFSKRKLDLTTVKSIQLLTNEVEDLSIVSRFDKFHLKALHLHAIIATMQGRVGRAKKFYIAALDKMEKGQDSKAVNSYTSPASVALILDALSFWNSFSIIDKFPINSSALNLIMIQKKLRPDRSIDKQPRMLFSTEKFNYPFE